ncbi:hypothetical protein N8205_02845 [Flavobacteriaceae bacterium]|nr:hypothetical protein [Flavobacteriaceae bacterium]MDC1471708.1 hypothetical protein [Flavobacteriaceae bacterium]|tara:strand:- start:754 stop:1212 length:459 start_codon:yes stop_codon:yes gene_type:complete
MKKLTLLSALLIFACSSDDSSNNDNSEQTFLQGYENAVFECQNCPVNSDYTSPLYVGFTPSDNFLYYNYDFVGCNYIFEGNLDGLNDDWGVVTITNNTINNLTYTKTYSDGVERYSYDTNGTSLNLDIEWTDGEAVSFIYLSSELTVNNICN